MFSKITASSGGGLHPMRVKEHKKNPAVQRRAGSSGPVRPQADLNFTQASRPVVPVAAPEVLGMSEASAPLARAS